MFRHQTSARQVAQHQRHQRRLRLEMLENRLLLAAELFQQKIYAQDLAPQSDHLGQSVSIDGDYAVIGAPNAQVLSGSSYVQSGSAYVYQRHDPGTPADPNDDFWLFQAQLIPTDLSSLSSDNFGYSVSISGDTVAVGAFGDDDVASYAGAAYIFQKDAGGTDQWGQVQKLTHSLGEANNYFGYSVALDNDTLVVGAYRDGDFGNYSGSAVVFDRDFGGGDNWGERTTLFAADAAAADFFGYSLSISGDTIVVGANGDDDLGSASGAAYVFERDLGSADNWGQAKKIIGSTTNSSDRFGQAVSIDADTIVVGAYSAGSGAAYVFQRDQGGGENWGEVLQLATPAGTYDFGWSVDVDLDQIIVGASSESFYAGAAYVFARDQGGAGQWGQVQRLLAADGANSDYFGISAAISNGTVLVGARYDDDGSSTDTDFNSGSAYLFSQDFGGVDNWGQQQKLTNSNPRVGDQSGTAVAMDGDTLVVGVPQRERSGQTDTGEAYVFQRHDAGTPSDTTDDFWLYQATLFASDDDDQDAFGTSVAIHGDTIVVGAPEEDAAANNAGAAYVFDRNLGGTNTWLQRKKLTASNAAADDAFGTSVAIAGNTVVVGALRGDGAVADTGTAYVFDRGSGGANNWGQVKLLVASNQAAADEFGHSVSISDDTILVGARLGDGAVADVGTAYVYDRDSGGAENWGEVKRLDASDAAAGDEFGFQVSVRGDTALVGAPQNGNGAAYTFLRDQGGANNWGETKLLTAADGAAGDQFGFAVALDGDTAIIGANLDDSSLDTGSAYVFERNVGGSENWGQLFKSTAPDASDSDAFGSSVAISGNRFSVGAPSDDDGGVDAGAVYTYGILRDVQVTVAPTSVSEDGATNLEYTFTRSGATIEPLVVQFSVGGDALVDDDYQLIGATDFDGLNGTVTFAQGASSVVLTVDPTADGNLEPDETVEVSLTAGEQYQIGVSASAVGTISNDDEVDLTVTPAMVAEDGAGNAVFLFSRADSVGSLTVNFTIAGSAELGVDYVQTGATTFDALSGVGTIVFADTESSVTLTLDPTSDSLVELDEWVTLTLAAGTGYNLSLPTPVTATIENDDAATISVTDVTQVETNGNTTFTFDVILTGVVDTDVAVKAGTSDGLAVSGEDFDFLLQDIVFPANTASPQMISVDVTVTGDTVVELDETFFLAVTSIEAGAREVVFDALQETVHISQLSPDVGHYTNTYATLVSPDSQRVVYVADQDTDNVYELYSTSVLGGAKTKLNGTLVANGGVSTSSQAVQISPDGTTVFYLAAQDTANVYELYRVPIDGSAAPMKLSGSLTVGGSVQQNYGFQLSADGSQVVYVADQDSDDVYELYSVPTDGSTAPIKLNGGLVAGGDVQQNAVQITPDGTRVVYLADQDTDNVYELYSVPIDGSAAATKLNGGLITNGDVDWDFQISPDSSTVVYAADQTVANRRELFSVAVTGGTATKLNSTIISTYNSLSFKISPDSSTVVYTANGQQLFPTSYAELFAVPIAGGTITQLSNESITTREVLSDFEFTSDGQTVIYTGRDTNYNQHLFSVPVDASAVPTELNGPSASASSSSVAFEISPDDQTVVYTYPQDSLQDELYAVPISGGASTKLNGPLFTTSSSYDVQDFAIRPDGGSVVYRAYQDNYFRELYSVPIGGGAATKVSNDAATNAVGSYQLSADSQAIVFKQTTSSDQLWSSLAAVVGTGTITNEDTATISVADVSVSEALGQITLTATLTGQVDTGFSVNWETVDGTADDGSDYSGIASSFYLSGADGAQATITLQIATDNIVELNETFIVDLLSHNSGRSGITLVDGTGTILNDDTATLSVTGGTLVEGDSGTTQLDFIVKLLGFVQGGLEVPFQTVDGTAKTGDNDYVATSGNLQFAGTSFVDLQTVSVDVQGDTTVEWDESFVFELGNLSASAADTNAIIVVGAGAIGRIENDDSATLSINDVSQPEPDSGTAPFTFTATLTQPLDESVIVTYDVLPGTATFADGDLATASGSFGIPAGQTSATFTVLVHGDKEFEANETFTVHLSAVQAGGRDLAISDPDGEGTIVNDDRVDSLAIYDASSGIWETRVSDTTQFIAVPGATIQAASPWTNVMEGDFNGDGFSDIFRRNASTGALRVLVSDGSGSFTDEVWGTVNSNSPWGHWLIGDFDGDGDDDVLRINTSSGGVRVLTSSGSGFSDQVWGSVNPNSPFVGYAVGDFTGDGKDDVVRRNSVSGGIRVLQSNGVAFSDLQWGSYNPNSPWTDWLVGDFDGSGNDDLFRWNATGGGVWVMLSNNTAFSSQLWGSLDPNSPWMDFRVADFDGNGSTDVIRRHDTTGDLSLLYSNNGISFDDSVWGSVNPNVAWQDYQVADFTGDGLADLARIHPTTGAVRVLESSPNGFADDDLWSILDPNDLPDLILTGGFGVSPQPLLAAGGENHGDAEVLSEESLAFIADAAIDLWQQAGISTQQLDQLRGVSFEIADLSGAYLGLATPQRILIDSNAAGYGWFVDRTPLDDAEFTTDDAEPASLSASTRMDLLSAVMHEIGHVLGLDDLHDEALENDRMYETLAVGVRRTG